MPLKEIMENITLIGTDMKKDIQNKEHIKGFNQIKIKDLSISNQDVYNKLQITDLEKENLSINNKNIIDKVKSSYENFFNKKSLKEDQYILSEFELFELSKLEDKNFIRYLIYRYIYNMYPRLKIVEDFPPCVQLEPTSKCNFRCNVLSVRFNIFSKKAWFYGRYGF